MRGITRTEWTRWRTAAAVLLALAAGPALAQSTSCGDDRVDPACDDLPRLRQASTVPVEASFRNGIARSLIAAIPVQGRDPVARARDFLKRFGDLYGLGPDRDLRVRRVTTGGRGRPESVLFYQAYRGLPVHPAELVVGLRGHQVVSVVGGVLPRDAVVDTRPRISADAARALARREGGRTARTDATTLVVYDRGLYGTVPSNPRLAWRVALRGNRIGQVFVDALTGEKLATLPSGQGHGGPLEGIDYVVHDAESEANSWDDSCFNTSFDPLVSDDDGGLQASYVGDVEAEKADEYARKTWEWYHTRFGHHSYDNDDSLMAVYMRSDGAVDPDDGKTLWSSYCELMQIQTGWVDFEIVTHEFTHGVIQFASDLEYACESGALNESYADVMAGLADREMYSPANWSLFENRVNGQGSFRHLKTPEVNCKPDHVSAPTQNGNCNAIAYVGCLIDDGDNGGVHTNSSIANKTAYLMTDGGFTHGVHVQGMGAHKTREIKYHALMNLPSNASFQDAANWEIATVASVAGTFSWTADDVCTVRNAWAAVGVGLNDFDCNGGADGMQDMDGDWVPDGADNCDNVPNPLQTDLDWDGIGDPCEDDIDSDGFDDDIDTCVTMYNPGQEGPCEDLDGDGDLNIPNQDNCPTDYNPSQTDSDLDGWGDACEVDSDGDGDNNDTDNCPFQPNSDQADTDGDGYGDVCDKCPNTADDVIAFTPVDDMLSDILGETAGGVPYQPDSDGDGVPDTCDPTLRMNGQRLGYGRLRPGSRGVMEVNAEAIAERHVRTEISPCPGRCPEYFAPTDGVQLQFEGVPAGVHAWISDDRGRSVAQDRSEGGRRTLRFPARGGRRYFLNFYLGPNVREPRIGFDVKVSAWRVPPETEPEAPAVRASSGTPPGRHGPV